MLFFVSSTRIDVSPVLVTTMILFSIILNMMAWLLPQEITLIAAFIGAYILPLIISIMFVYWSVITCIDAPWFAKTPAKLLLLSSILIIFLNVFLESPPYEIIIPVITTFSILIAGVIFKHPGILAFLPYKARYIVLLDKKGEIVFEQYWTASKGQIPAELKEEGKNLVTMLRQFEGLVEGTRVGAKGIDLELNGSIILINTGSRHFNAGLIANRSSQALLDGFSFFMRKVDEIQDNAGYENKKDISIPVMAILKKNMLNLDVIM
jgi:hypothetical protein